MNEYYSMHISSFVGISISFPYFHLYLVLLTSNNEIIDSEVWEAKSLMGLELH